MTESREYDVAVLGGGPAGCTLALRLVAMGYRVTLLTVPRRGATEGFSARTLDALARAGCSAALGTVGPAVERRATWNGRTAAPNTEHVVNRTVFDAALLLDVAHAGVEIARARVRSVAPGRRGWTVAGETADGGRLVVAASFVVEARGRSAPVRATGRGPATICLSQPWRFSASTTPRSAVSAFPGGWAWHAVGPDGHGVVQLCVDPPHERVLQRLRLIEFYRAQLGSVPRARRWLVEAEAAGDITAADASPRLASGLVGDGFLRVGDAAAAIDPLSGHGVFEAVAGAVLAAPVVNTLLRSPRDGRLAAAFYRQRLRATFGRLCRTGQALYAAERRWSDAPFWAARGAWPEQQPAPRTAPERVAIARRAVVADDRVVRRSVLVTPAYPHGVYQVHGVPIVPLIALLRHAAADKSDPWLQAAAGHLQRPPGAVERAVAWLRAHDVPATVRVRASRTAQESV